MAASSEVYQNKRGRDEYWTGEFALPKPKRTNSRTFLALDTALMSLLEKNDNMDDNDSNVGIKGVISSMEKEIGLKAQEDHDIEFKALEDHDIEDHDIEFKALEDHDIGLKAHQDHDEIGLKAQNNHDIDTDEKPSSDQMYSIKQGQLEADGNTEATTVTPDIWDLTYYDDVVAEPGFLVEDLITPHELGIYGDSMSHNMYSDAVYGYAETTEVFYGSLWEDDIWYLNELPVIQNDFELPQQEEFGIMSGV